MSLKKITLLAIVGLLCACKHEHQPQENALTPLPQSMERSEGNFNFAKKLSVATANVPIDSLQSTIDVFTPILSELSGKEIKVTDKGSGDIVFALNDTIAPEGYRLDVTPDGVSIQAATAPGFFYAMQTLRQLMETAPEAGIEAVTITDAPRFGWRGFMLDEGRHIFGKDEVKRVIDMMALHKLNRFHWHLTEDQGWRIEIKKYPKLTEIGSKRGSTKLAWGEMVRVDSLPYEGYYTQDDIREIVDYARERFVEIVPEIDIPGHTQAAVASYPEILACDPQAPHEVWLHQGVSADVINVANPAAVEMSKDIIDEVIDLFPFPWLHLGGDECPTAKWKDNAQCRAKLKEIGSKDYRDLQLDYYRQLQDHIAAKEPQDRRHLIFWNEVLHGNTDLLIPDYTIMAWIGREPAEAAALEAATMGLNTILTPQIPYYINRKQSEAPDEPLSQGRGKETVEAVYEYAPMANVPDSVADKYLGVQANFWSEYVDTPDFLEYLMMPRLAAVAEAAWTPQEKRDYSDFKERVINLSKLYDKMGWNYAKHIFAADTTATDSIAQPAN